MRRAPPPPGPPPLSFMGESIEKKYMGWRGEQSIYLFALWTVTAGMQNGPITDPVSTAKLGSVGDAWKLMCPVADDAI